MTVRTSSPPRALEFELANGDCIRMTLMPFAIVGELSRNGVRLTQARFPTFAAAGKWIDAELRVAAGSHMADGARDLFMP